MSNEIKQPMQKTSIGNQAQKGSSSSNPVITNKINDQISSNRSSTFIPIKDNKSQSKPINETSKTSRSVSLATDSPLKTNLNISIAAYNLLAIKNKLLCDLTRAIQLVQKAYLEKGNNEKILTNSDYLVHELCQQFDYVFLYGLKSPQESYWKMVLEFTHRNVISDLKKLLNVTTNFGLSRAWIYHALNDNLMESYLKCILDNKKLVERYYKKESSLMSDDQAVTVLFTLVAGLENVEFKLQNDVPYLDHSCWPTHLTMKRQVVDVIMNSSPQSLTELVDSLNDSAISNQSHSSFGIVTRPEKNNIQKIGNNSQFNSGSDTKSKAGSQKNKHKRANTANISNKAQMIRHANNISFDNISSTSSNNNLSDLNSNLNDESSETSGRYTAVSANTPPNQSNGEFFSLINNYYNTGEHSYQQNNQLCLRNMENKNYRNILNNNNHMSHEESEDDLDRMVSKKSKNAATNGIIISKSLKNNDDAANLMEKMISLSVKQNSTLTKNILLNKALENSTNDFDFNQQQDKIDNEINKLRKENYDMLINNNSNQADLLVSSKMKSNNGSNKLKKSESKQSNSFNQTSNQELADTSLKASQIFDNKIKHIENYSQIIEKATLEMDAYVKDMNSVYGNYDKLYSDELVDPNELLLISDEISNNKLINNPDIYQMESKVDIYDELSNKNKENKENNNLVNTTIKPDFFISSTSSIQTPGNTSNPNLQDDNSSYKFDKDFDKSSQVTSITSKETQENEDYLECAINVNDLKQEIRIDNNTKLFLSIEIFQNGQNEEFVKLYHATQGHTQGEIEAINLLITSFGVYILKRKEASEKSSNETTNNNKKFEKISFINHNQMDYIEVSLCDQAIHFVCINKRQNCWITFGSRKLTENILDNLQSSRLINKSLKYPRLQIFHEATQQRLAIKKFISTEENEEPQDITINSYSLVYWEDQASAVNHLIHKEGYLLYFNKSSSSSSLSSAEWKKGYFVLKNDVLSQYKSSHDKRPTQVIKLNGEDFSGCRKNNNSPKANTIELILSNSNILYLVSKTESEASDWLQCFCKIISLGNYHTDVPSHSCLPCCSIITNSRIYFCHEDLNSGFYRLLESIKLQEINRISFDNYNPYYCILHDDLDSKANRYWFIYFADEFERNEFISSFKKAWENLFQVQFNVEFCKSSEMRKRCIRGVRLIQKIWDDSEDTELN